MTGALRTLLDSCRDVSSPQLRSQVLDRPQRTKRVGVPRDLDGRVIYGSCANGRGIYTLFCYARSFIQV